MNAEFVANMEDVLDVHALSYDHKFPVVCVDESCKQLLEEVRPPLPARSGEIARKDDEYIRKVLAEIFLAIEPHTGKISVTSGETRGAKDWAMFIQELLDVKYPTARKVFCYG